MGWSEAAGRTAEGGRRALIVASLAVAGVAAAALASSARGAEEKELRAGAIGLDTSHAVAFADLFNDTGSPDRVPGLRIVAAFPGGSPDLPASIDRVPEYTAHLRDKRGVEIVKDIESLLPKVDVVLLLSVDGRPHLAQAKPVIAARKPLYIDKPFTASLADAREIFRLAKEAGVPVFSSSALRFVPAIAAARTDPSLGGVAGCDAFSPYHIEPHHPDLFWYGIHGVEILFTVMGPGCESVSRTTGPDQDVVVGRWKDGRIGTWRGVQKGEAPYGALIFGTKKVVRADFTGGNIYKPMLESIVKFFRTGVAPVSPEETLQIIAFMEAADASKKEGGRPVKVEN
jgi:predicted dehydrogenase